MAVKPKTSQHFQTIIIGGGLTGLVIANRLRQLGEHVALVEELEHLGGEDRPHPSTFGAIDHGLKVIPATPDAERALQFLRTSIPYLEWTSEEAPPLTFDSGHFKPFVGFGSKPLEANEEVAHYTSAQRLIPNLPVHEWVARLQGSYDGELLLKSFVTFIYHEGERVTAIQINSKETLTADRFIYCGQPKELLKYGFANSISGRNRQKLSKAQFWTSIGLELFHSQQVTDSPAVHVLWSQSDDGSPCVGHFHSSQRNQDVVYQHSQWMTFVPFELTEDNELTGAAIRKIKKQLKRAYPTAFEKLHGEIIFVGPGSHGYVALKQDDGQLVPPFENFFIAGPHLEATNPVVGALLQAENILQQWPQAENKHATTADTMSDYAATGSQI